MQAYEPERTNPISLSGHGLRRPLVLVSGVDVSLMSKRAAQAALFLRKTLLTALAM
jgi:hypothetical protein